MTLDPTKLAGVRSVGAVHSLKTWPAYFEAVRTGEKAFEVRKNDRAFRVGDVLELEEFDPGPDGGFTGRVLDRRVAYMLDGGAFGVEPGFCVLGIEPLEPAQSEAARWRERAEGLEAELQRIVEVAPKDHEFSPYNLEARARHCGNIARAALSTQTQGGGEHG